MLNWVVFAASVGVVLSVVTGAVAEEVGATGSPALREVDTLRAENAMLRRQVERLMQRVAELEGITEPAVEDRVEEAADTVPPIALTSSKALPTAAEISRLRLLVYRVGRGDTALAEELSTLRTNLHGRLRHGFDEWTVQDLDERCKLDKRILQVLQKEGERSWTPLIALLGAANRWVTLAADREELVVRLRAYERHVFDESYVTRWDQSDRRSIVRVAVNSWLVGRSIYKSDWDRRQFHDWLASKGVKSFAPLEKGTK